MSVTRPVLEAYARFTRRRVIAGAFAGATATLLAACGGAAPQKSSRSTGASVATRPSGPPTGQLNVTVGTDFPANLDFTSSGYAMSRYGMAEMLMRTTSDGKLQPWLAKSIENVNPVTWRVHLRPNVTFWDGSTVNASAVAASFRYNWDRQPTADALISKNTQLNVINPMTLEFKAPSPSGSFANALSTQYFVIGKPGPNNTSILTSGYRPTQFETNQQVTLEPYANYWGGSPPIARITVTLQPDSNSRVLALQSGNVNMTGHFPPQAVKTLGGDLQVSIVTATRLNLAILNVNRPPFNDPVVRQATALSIDRDALAKVSLEGMGAPATSLFPQNAGVDATITQTTDTSQAKQLLNQDGWKTGADGVRVKDGKRLAFTFYSSPSRGEITPMAVQMQAQLKSVGYDVQVQELQNISVPMKSGNWDAALSSIDVLVTGDPAYMLNYLLDPTTYIYGGYVDPQFTTIVNQLRVEPDPTKREQISHQAQLVLKQDQPYLYLVNPPIITAFNKTKVHGFVPSPNDLYFLNNDVWVSS